MGLCRTNVWKARHVGSLRPPQRPHQNHQLPPSISPLSGPASTQLQHAGTREVIHPAFGFYRAATFKRLHHHCCHATLRPSARSSAEMHARIGVATPDTTSLPHTRYFPRLWDFGDGLLENPALLLKPKGLASPSIHVCISSRASRSFCGSAVRTVLSYHS